MQKVRALPSVFMTEDKRLYVFGGGSQSIEYIDVTTNMGYWVVTNIKDINMSKLNSIIPLHSYPYPLFPNTDNLFC